MTDVKVPVMNKAEVKQITEYSTENFSSRYCWKLESFSNFPRTWLTTEKIDIEKTNYYWMLQIIPGIPGIPGSSPGSGEDMKFLLGFHGRKIEVQDFSNTFYEFKIKAKNTVCWMQPLSSLPFSGLLLSKSNVFDNFDKRSYVDENGCLTILVKVIIKTNRFLKDITLRSVNTTETLCNELQALLASDDLKDVNFKIDNKNISAHKTILAARSAYFKKMFTIDMVESQTNEVLIPDTSYDTFEEMLHFIYTGRVTSTTNFSFLAMELFVAAHRYQIEDLQKMCENEILENLNEQNSAEVLDLVHLYDCDESLKREALRLFKISICNSVMQLKLNSTNQSEVVDKEETARKLLHFTKIFNGIQNDQREENCQNSHLPLK